MSGTPETVACFDFLIWLLFQYSFTLSRSAKQLTNGKSHSVKMELDWTYNEERQRGTLRHSSGMEARREKKAWSTQNNMEENG